MRKASVRWRVVWIVGLFLLWLLCSGSALAGSLSDRLSRFPDWQAKPLVQSATGDLVYPDWLAGEWMVTTTLLDLAAPLAPDVTTPGFESNRQYLDQPVTFKVRFVEQQPRLNGIFSSLKRLSRGQKLIVADRAFNGQNLAEAYLGDRIVLSVRVDPNNPNRQITLLQGDRQLISTITGRATETPNSDQFITTEVFQQVFRGAPQLYFNEVETTTAYRRDDTADPAISADQVTAIYLSPQDPDYFKVGDSPVALYRYRLEFSPAAPAD